MSKVLIVAKTKHGNRAKPILKSEAQKLVENGEAIRKKDGIYIMMDKVGKVKEEETPKVKVKAKPKKKTYKTKILEAE